MPALSLARRILVTGASGFVGRYLAAYLQSHGCEVVAWNTDVDIRDAAVVSTAMQRAQPDAVIHLAAIAAPAAARADPRAAWDVNVSGTLNLAQATLRHAPTAAFVFVGSSQCYGLRFNDGAGPVKEDTAFAPTNVYGATKAAADIMIGQMAHDGLRAVRLRPFNHTGPGQPTEYVVSHFAQQIAAIELRGQEGSISVGNLDARRDFFDVRDVVKAYAAACTAVIEPGTAINLSTGRPRSVREILDDLIAASTAQIDVAVDPARLRPDDVPCASGDPSRAAALLGWQPEIPLAQTLADVLAYWRAELRSSHGR